MNGNDPKQIKNITSRASIQKKNQTNFVYRNNIMKANKPTKRDKLVSVCLAIYQKWINGVYAPSQCPVHSGMAEEAKVQSNLP